MIDGLTPTETRIMNKLSDGFVHSADDLHECLCDDLGPAVNVQMHISNLRPKLIRHGLLIAYHNGQGYQLARPLRSANNGRA